MKISKLFYLLSLVILLQFIVFADISNNFIDEVSIREPFLKTSKVSGKIYINGNQGWADFRNDGNCTGQGTWVNPYMISNLEIDAYNSSSCIFIENSDVPFIIQNCTVYNASKGSGAYLDAGIKLLNTMNGRVINNTVLNNKNS